VNQKDSICIVLFIKTIRGYDVRAVIYSTDRERLEREVRIETYRAGGPGGQHRNKADTAVRLHHEPSGLTITASERRSQSMNRELAFERLIERLKKLNFRPKKRRPTKPTKGSQRRRVDAKKRRAQVKKRRGRVASDD